MMLLKINTYIESASIITSVDGQNFVLSSQKHLGINLQAAASLRKDVTSPRGAVIAFLVRPTALGSPQISGTSIK